MSMKIITTTKSKQAHSLIELFLASVKRPTTVTSMLNKSPVKNSIMIVCLNIRFLFIIPTSCCLKNTSLQRSVKQPIGAHYIMIPGS